MRNLQTLSCGLLLVAVVFTASAKAQVRSRFPLPGESTTVFQNPGGAPPFRTPPPGSLAPVTPPGVTFGAPSGSTAPGIGGATLQSPSFDPYAAPGAANVAPSLNTPPGSTPYGVAPYNPPATGSPYGTAPLGANPYGAPPSQPPWTQPYGAPASPYGAAPGNPYGAAPNGAAPGNPYYSYPNQPPAQYPSGVGGPNWWNPQPGPYLRLFSDLRLRYTWLAGDSGRDLDINDVDIAATVNFPNFFGCGDPLRISPGFSFHFWDGPDTIPPVTADLPAQAYSAYVDARWDPKFGPIFGAELGLSVGVYTDFESVTSNSIRVQGVGLLVMNLTPTVAIKGGIEYLDRVKVKILPAFGVVWRPTPQVKWDIYFPRPKLAQYLTTLGNTDVWWYVGGEYGGGSWTIERIGKSDQADINDIRLFAGLEWMHQIGLKGFFEVGYVFDREIVYRFNPQDNLDVNDTVMLRAGIAF